MEVENISWLVWRSLSFRPIDFIGCLSEFLKPTRCSSCTQFENSRCSLSQKDSLVAIFFKKISREEAGRKIIITHDSKPHVRFPLNAVKQNYRSVTNDLLHVGGIVSSPSKPEFFKIFFPLISLTNARLRVSFLYLIIIPGLTLLDPKAGAWQVTNILFCHAWRVKRAWQRNTHWPWVGKQRVLSWLRG